MTGSTANTFHTRNTRRHGRIADRGWSYAQKLLRHYEITQRDIEELSGIPLATVNRVITGNHQRVQFAAVYNVRNTIQTMLEENGWAGTPEELWTEYDQPLTRVAS